MIEIVLRSFAAESAWDSAMRRRPNAVFVCAGRSRVPCGIGRGGVRVILGRDATLVALNLLARPEGSTREEVAELLFAGREDGGPDGAEKVISQYRVDAKLALAAIGFAVTTSKRSVRQRAFELGGVEAVGNRQ